jgi:hypothetical protein
VENDQLNRVTRRVALKILAGAAGAAAHGGGPALHAMEDAHCQTAAVARPAAALPQFFTAEQMRVLAALTEALIPADEHSPGAVAAGVPAYIDSYLHSAPAGAQEEWRRGLEALDRVAKEKFENWFADCTAEEREQLLLSLSAHEETPSSPEEQFFVTAKRLTVEGYYHSKVGLDQDLQYVGNEVLAEFEGCTHPQHGAALPPKS